MIQKYFSDNQDVIKLNFKIELKYINIRIQNLIMC